MEGMVGKSVCMGKTAPSRMGGKGMRAGGSEGAFDLGVLRAGFDLESLGECFGRSEVCFLSLGDLRAGAEDLKSLSGSVVSMLKADIAGGGLSALVPFN